MLLILAVNLIPHRGEKKKTMNLKVDDSYVVFLLHHFLLTKET